MRNLKVETYLEMSEFMKELPFQENVIYVTASSSLAMYLKYLNQFYYNKNYIWTYEGFRKAVFPEYYDNITEWNMKTLLRSLIDDVEEKESKKYLHKNREQMYYLFQFYLRSGFIHLNEEYAQDKNEKIERQLYNKWVSSELLKHVYFAHQSFTKETLVARVNAYFNKKYNKDKDQQDLKKIEKIVFLNLTFIDPGRFYFIKQLEKIGIEITFCIPGNGYQLPWKRTYDFVSEENWCASVQKTQSEKESAYTSYLKGVYQEAQGERVTVKQYHDILEFKEQLKNKPIYQSNSQMERKEPLLSRKSHNPATFKFAREYVNFSKERFNLLFSSTIVKYKHKHIHYFDSQEGKFLESLYDVKWDEEGVEILLSYESYCKIIVSGWIETKRGLNGRGSYDILMELKPYMEGVQSLSEIENRLARLVHVQEFSAVFEETAKDKIVGDQIKRYLQNPLEVLPYADNSRWSLTVKQLLELTKRFQNIYIQLVRKDNTICLKEHVQKLWKLWSEIREHQMRVSEFGRLKQLVEIQPDRQDDFKEFRKANRLFLKTHKRLRALSRSIEDEKTYLPEEIKDFLRIQLKFPFQTQYSQEDWEEDDGFNLTKSFAQIDGITVNGTKEIYVTDLSEKSLNQYVSQDGSVLELLDSKMFARDLEDLVFYSHEEKRIILSHLKQEREVSLGFIKYFIGNLMTSSSAKIEFSMISEIHENDHPSAILRVLDSLYKEKQGESVDYETIKVLKQSLTESMEQVERFTAATIEGNRKLPMHISTLGWLDWDFCAYKFFLNNVVSFHPVYTEEFQQRLAFSELGKILMSQDSNSFQMRKYFFYLFPQWNQTLKENMLDTTFIHNIRENVSYENVKFPYDMRSLQLLRSIRSNHTRSRAVNAYRERIDRGEKFWDDFMKKDWEHGKVKTNRGNHCTMCPYKLICVKGEYPIERRNY